MTTMVLPDSDAPPSMPPALTCQIDVALPILSLSDATQLGSSAVYRIGRRRSAEFSVQRFGLFTGRKRTIRVRGNLSLDADDARIIGLDLRIDPETVDLDWIDRLMGPTVVTTLPPISFHTTAVRAAPSSHRWILRGLLNIGGTPRLQTIDVRLLERVLDTITGTEIASFMLDGRITPSEFGLSEDRRLLGDPVVLTTRFDVEISPAG